MDDETGSAVVKCDVAVIGAGSAGLAAALMLGRLRRSVVVVDAGDPRNAPAAHMHGYLGFDGRSPQDLLAAGREEVRRYGGRVVEGSRASPRHDGDGGFRIDVADGTTLVARRVLVATGLVDLLPEIPGLAGQWGRGVIHCPYCHGWEVRDQAIVVVATSPIAVHQAALFRQLSPNVTVVVHDGAAPDHESVHRLANRGVGVVDGPVAEVLSDEHDRLSAVRLANGTVLPADAVVVGARVAPRVEAVAELGVAIVADISGMGEVIQTDAMGQTSVAGVYAAGNVADVRAQVLSAAAAGAMAGAAINADLVAEDMEQPMAVPDTSADWDARYADHPQMWSGRPNDVLVVEMSDAVAGRALDVGCGEGADAIWLAKRGWTTTGLDVSQVALDRAAQAAAVEGAAVTWVCADMATAALDPGLFDLVSVHYPALRHTPGDDAIRALLDAVAPGGTLLVVGHAPLDVEFARSHGFDPANYVQPPDVAAGLDDSWEVPVDEERPRVVPPAAGVPFTDDAVLRARRR